MNIEIKVVDVNRKQYLVVINNNGVLVRSVVMIKNPVYVDSRVCTQYDTLEDAIEVFNTLSSDYLAKGDWVESPANMSVLEITL
jgi:hypothetical protein